MASLQLCLLHSSLCYHFPSHGRQLIDIESISGNEAAVANYLYGELCRVGYSTRKMAVEADRFNLYATSPEQPNPTVVFSTHMDTVPPFIPSSEDESRIYGRGSCDAKGIIAAQIAAAERLRPQGIYVGLLFVVGEERDSLGAKVANDYAASQPAHACKYLVNGEPTENHIALASKGTLRVEVTAAGRMAHSAYPELGDSAIDKLLAAQRNSRLRSRRLALSPRRSVDRIAPPDSRDRNHFSERRLSPGTSLPPPAHRRWITHHDREVHHRHSQTHELGRAAPARSRIDSRRPHRRRIHREEAARRGDRFVLHDYEEADLRAA